MILVPIVESGIDSSLDSVPTINTFNTIELQHFYDDGNGTVH